MAVGSTHIGAGSFLQGLWVNLSWSRFIPGAGSFLQRLWLLEKAVLEQEHLRVNVAVDKYTTAGGETG